MSAVLGLRLGRRLIAAAALQDDQIIFRDSRYVSSRRSTVDAATTQYFARLLDQVKPVGIYYYAPAGEQTVTAQLSAALERLAGNAGVPAMRLSRTDVFAGFGVTPLKTRRELRDQALALWPVISEAPGPRQAVVSEAIIAAVVGDLRRELPPT